MNKTIKTIRYMGNKNKLLDFIIPEILSNSKENDVVCDLMGGTCCIGYALKPYRIVYENDVQYYSFIIAKGLVKNSDSVISKKIANNELSHDYFLNKKENVFSFFTKKYSDTYFSKEQCNDIDSIRYAISKIKNESKQSLYLISLMNSMCSCESTSGHFAQYLPASHPRLKSIRQKNLWDEFLKKCDDFKKIVKGNKDNKCFNTDYKNLINMPVFDNVKLVYIDPPYTGEQYSRFYHILETVCKYDNPMLEHKGLYRIDRFTSSLSLRKIAFDEFNHLLQKLSELNKKVVLSYSTKGLLKEYEMEHLFKSNFKKYYIKRIDYNHSTQGKGNVKLEELLFIGFN